MKYVKHRYLIRLCAVSIIIYASIISVTGGFDLLVGPVLFRSHQTGWLFRLAAILILVDLLATEGSIGIARSILRAVVRKPAVTVPRMLSLLLGAALAVVLLWSVARIIDGMTEEIPLSDFAILEAYTLRTLRNEQLVGPYSRLGWHHPGPALFYLFKPLYQMSGHRFESLRWSALLLNLGCLAATLTIVRRRGRPVLFITTVVGFGVYLTRVPELLASPWNPDLIVLPLALLLTACAAVIDGDHRFAVVIAVIGSFLIQTHVAVTPTVALLCAAAFVWLVAGPPHTPANNRWISANVALWAMIAMWILPISQELASPGQGNLSAIYASFFHEPLPGPDVRISHAAFLDILSASLMPGFSKAWGQEVVPELSVLAFVVALGTLLALPWAATQFVRDGNRFGAGVTWLSLSSSIAAWWSILRTQGVIFDHVIFWISIIGMLNTACVAAAAALWLSQRVSGGIGRLRSPDGLTTALAVLCLTLVTATGVSHLYETHRLAVENPAADRVRQASTIIQTYLTREGLQRPLVRIAHPTWYEAAGVVLALQKSGWPVAIEPDWRFMYGEASAATGMEDCELVFADAETRPRLRDEQHTLLAQWPEFSIHARHRVSSTERQ